MVDFNLVISCGRNLERRARDEILRFLKKLGDDDAAAIEFGYAGLIGVKTKLDPFKVVKEIDNTVNENPWAFRFILKVVPVERVVPTEISKIKEAVKDLLDKIKTGETFKVQVRKRGSSISSRELIKEVAELVDNPVNLDKPDKIIQIEIIDEYTGVAVIRPKDIVSVASKKGL